ncbi:uncharacterized protein LOC123988989 [Osmia bicornis bicornis]|uniref:uncharacterized protein LOC123988989 n=1 Tax=Osmia bicornis bicornis TaxID=1437191 RepID=UPI001EAF345B|nr:uncharacterized protein LOC123988989 [Osmia bicornis bicornis]
MKKKGTVDCTTEAVKNIKNEAREVTLGKWQQRWEESDKGRWTYALIPRLKEWILWGPQTLNFHLTQVLTGHGCFGTFLWKKARKQANAECWFCPDLEDSPEHFLFECSRWKNERLTLCSKLGVNMNRNNFIELLRDGTKREGIIKHVVSTLRDKEAYERGRQREENRVREVPPTGRRTGRRI